MSYQLTRPDTDQVKFTSSRTGEWLLEDYLQSAELGNRTLAALMADLFNPTTGVLIQNPTPAQIIQSFENAAAALASEQAAAASVVAAEGQVALANAARAASEDILVYLESGPVFSVNGDVGIVVLPKTQVVAYDNRATLRSQSPSAGDYAIVEGLGLFSWFPASTEPDDDESAFATASGVWLLQAASWDLIDAWQAPDQQAFADDDEDEPARLAAFWVANYGANVLTGSATCAIASVASITSASFTGTVTGSSVGDRVIAQPPSQLGVDAASTGRLAYHAWVSAANTVTVMLTNASAASATTNAAIQTAWPITVIKT